MQLVPPPAQVQLYHQSSTSSWSRAFRRFRGKPSLLARKSATGSPNRELWPYALVASGLLTPVVFSLAASVVRPLFFHRFLIICLPAWLLAVAVGASALRQRRMRVLAIAGVCLLSLMSTVISYTRVREDWRGVANYLIAHAKLAGPRGVLPGRGQFRGRKLSRLAARWKRATGRRRWKSVRNRTTGLRSSRVRGGCGWWSIPQTSTMTPRGRWRRSCTAATRRLAGQSFRAVTVTRVRGEERRTITAAADGQKTKADLHRLHG